MVEYVGGNWITFSSLKPLTSKQWSVVNAYANFSSAVLMAYKLRSVDPLFMVASAQSKVTFVIAKDLASGQNLPTLYSKVLVESVIIHGCRATMFLKLYYSNGRQLNYISSWVKPFNKLLVVHRKKKCCVEIKPNYKSTCALAICGRQ